jgi:hypothetical protein
VCLAKTLIILRIKPIDDWPTLANFVDDASHLAVPITSIAQIFRSPRYLLLETLAI